jgi:hypothetical protein
MSGIKSISSRKALVLASCLLLDFAGSARADVEITIRGSAAFLHSSRLVEGDEDTFLQFLHSSDAGRVKIIYLDSLGGRPPVAMAIGRLIRARGLDTAYHVGHGHCVSACTNVFLGGVHRYYIGGESVADGIATHVGLGFHPSHGGEAIEGRITAYFSEMGVPRAADLRYKVYPRDFVLTDTTGTNQYGDPKQYKLFFVSGEYALKVGVATSLAEPAEPDMRDE